MKILFVCTGNTCRSCMAEAIFNYICKQDNVLALSAGTNAIPGSKTSFNTAAVVRININTDISDRNAVQLTPSLIKEADLVFTMTGRIKNLLLYNFGKLNSSIFTLNEYVDQYGEIIDPYGMDISVYDKTYKQLNELIFLLIEKIKNEGM